MSNILDKIKQDIDGKKILIVGFGVEGQSTYRFVRHFFGTLSIGICDQDTEKIDAFVQSQKDENITKHTGDRYLDGDFGDYDLVFKTPGIPIDSLGHFPNQDIITSQIDVFLRHYGDRTIGITGTKGKSTTASLMYGILQGQDIAVALVGNIGIPAFDIMIDGNIYDHYVCELSSHQTESIHSSPHIALILNIYQDHLDYYRTYEKYIQAKMNIFANQSEGDYLLLGDNVDTTGRSISSMQTVIAYDDEVESITYTLADGEDITIAIEEMTLKGTHNLMNVRFCLEICRILGVGNAEKIKKAITGFAGLPHRMEYVGEYRGINYYNDSISTIPEATIFAMKALTDIDTIILGGYDRQIDYTELVEYLATKPVENVILLPESGYRIYDQLEDLNIQGLSIFRVYDLDEAVMLAYRYTAKGKTCLFSPAAASYGTFKNFIERGNKYKEWINLYGGV